jgi:hypothetical protein
MAAPSEEKLICDIFNLEALTVNQVKSFKALADGKNVFIGTKNFKIHSRSAKGGEKGDPNRNPWLAKMGPGRSEYFVHHIDLELRVHLMFD